jgi:hypothetical protein
MYGWRDQIFSLVGMSTTTATLAIARCLQPSAAGVGTHVQLGLPPCRFLALTGIPCPSCGLTTSFAFAAHFEFEEAFVASPFGLLLFFAVVLAMPVLCVQLCRPIAWARVFRAIDPGTISLWTVATYVASWFFKLTMTSVLGASLGN